MSAELFLIFVIVSVVGILRAQESAQYLQNAIRDLKNMNARNNQRRVDAVHVPSIKTHRSTMNNVPQLSLTKGELAALYEAAITKGDTIKLDPGDGPHIHAAVHEIDDGHEHEHGHGSSYVQDHHTYAPPPDDTMDHMGEDSAAGYYYYYYPLKSFIDEMSSQPSPADVIHHDDYHHHHYETTTTKPQPQYHSHTHQHNVHITPLKTMMDGDKKTKALEPLFMAISGFIGMAVMFILSILVLPKLNILKSRGVKPQGNPGDISNIARIALRAIEGKGCPERLACEMGQNARAFNLYDNRFVKLLRRMAPSSFRKHIDKVGKYTDKKHKCKAIQCKRKNGPGKKAKQPANNNNKKQ